MRPDNQPRTVSTEKDQVGEVMPEEKGRANASSCNVETPAPTTTATNAATPATTAPGVATNQVFALPELLENILLNISQVDLFVVERVNQTFYNTIKGSGKLERKKFAASKSHNTRPTNKDNKTSRCIFCNHPSCQYGLVAWPYKADANLSTFQNLYEQGKLQMMPFKDRYERIKDGVVCHHLGGDDKDEFMGWQGKKDVHESGSWRSIKLGTGGGAVKVRAGSTEVPVAHEMKKCGDIPAGGTLGDLFDVLQEYRETTAARKIESAKRWGGA